MASDWDGETTTEETVSKEPPPPKFLSGQGIKRQVSRPEDKVCSGNDIHLDDALLLVSRKWPPTFAIKDLFFAVLAWITFAFDYGTDVRLMIEYVLTDQSLLFILTLTFIAVPSFITGVISSVWYQQKYQDDQHQYRIKAEDNDTDKKHKEKHLKIAKRMYLARLVFSFLQLGRIFRQLEYIYCIVHSFYLRHQQQKAVDEKNRGDLERKDRNLRRRATFEKRDAAILGLMDGFLESALQLLLQLYLAMYMYKTLRLDFMRVSSLCASLVSTSLIQTTYYRANRKADRNTKNVSYLSSTFYFLWRFCELAPRYLLLALTCAVFTPWCFIAVPIHILFVFCLYRWQNPELKGICPDYERTPCVSKAMKHLFILMISYLGLLSFVNMSDGRSRKTATVFYVVFYIENIVMTMVLWYLSNTNDILLSGWAHVLWTMPVGMVCHTIFAMIFYKCMHPNVVKRKNAGEV